VIEQIEHDAPMLNVREERVPAYTLPDVLVCEDTTRVSSAAAWERKRRPEILEAFARLVYGRTPPVPTRVRFEIIDEDRAALGNTATRRVVRIHVPAVANGEYPIDAALLLPNARRGPAPVILFVNNTPRKLAELAQRGEPTGFWPFDQLLARGYAAAVFQTRDVQPDDDLKSYERGLIAALACGPRQQHAWGNIGAWAFAASRVMDYFETIPSEVDPKRVAIMGHSRGGKTALWASAQDPRFGLTIAGESGLMGAKLSRRNYGETFERLIANRPYWFCENYAAYSGHEHDLPVDQHELLALTAPRPLYISSADEDLLADPRGEFLGLVHAGPVYELYVQSRFAPDEMPGLEEQVIRGHTGYHIRRGKHDVTEVDWGMYMDFADRVWSDPN
jgi:hypothetical protein